MGIKKVPFDYEHPNKKKRGSKSAVLSVAQQATAPVVTTSNPKKGKRDGALKSKATTQKSPIVEVKQTQTIRLVVYPPVRGQIITYDEMVDSGLAPKQAILGLLKRGFPSFETNLLSGKVSSKTAEIGNDGIAVETNRSVSNKFLEKTKQVFDPFDVLSNRALGIKIGQAIIVQFARVDLNG